MGGSRKRERVNGGRETYEEEEEERMREESFVLPACPVDAQGVTSRSNRSHQEKDVQGIELE